MTNGYFTPAVAGPSQEHLFETAGLGKAPYKFLRVEVARGPIFFGNTQIGAFGQPMAACQFCGTAIVYKFFLRSSDGNEFWVGSDCIYKSGDLGLKNIIDPIVHQHEKEIREAREKAIMAQWDAYFALHPNFFKNDTRPHPWHFRAARGETMGMYTEYCFRYSGPTKKARLAREFLIAAGEINPKARKGHAKGQTCKCKIAIGDGDICESCLRLKSPTQIVAQVKKRFKTWACGVGNALGLTGASA